MTTITGDFDLTDPSTSVTTTTLQHTYRVRYILEATLAHREQSDWMWGSGLEFAAATTKFSATAKTSAGDESLAAGSFTAGALSVPLMVWYERRWRKWHGLAGIDVGIPIRQWHLRKSGDVTYDDDIGTAKRDMDTIKNVLDQRF